MPHPLNPPILPSPSFTPSNLRTATCVCDTQKTVILSGCCIYNVHCCLYFNTTASLLFFVALNNIHKSCSKLAKKKKEKKKPCDSTHLCPLCFYFNIFTSVVLYESLWGMVSIKKLNFLNVWACILEFKLAYCSSTYLKLYICNFFTGCKLKHEDPGFAWNLPSINAWICCTICIAAWHIPWHNAPQSSVHPFFIISMYKLTYKWQNS